jgi:hypothetical protein
MSPGVTYGLMTFLVGVIFLLGWLYATAGNPRRAAILKKSLWLFALPIIFTPGGWLGAHFGMWAVVAFEESLKTFASTREQNRNDRFWLVSLFGIWELTLDKPFWGYFLAQPIANWGRLEVSGLVYATALPVLMHTVTAAIYAFLFERRIWAAFIASCLVHASFNWAVEYFDLSATAAVVETAVLSIILIGILLGQSRRQTIAENLD